MILGDVCTRACGFCGVRKGLPLPVDPEEPYRVAKMAMELRLKHVVITSVTRDDLPDGGASHYAKTIFQVRQETTATIEVLVPDFFPEPCLEPDVFNHNLETVPRLYPLVRPSADYIRSLNLLKRTKKRNPGLITKSGIMLGFGESREEVVGVLEDLRKVDCGVVTIGQYLQPGKAQRPVAAYIPPEQFEEYREIGKKMGFLHVASGPFVRSSFNAGEIFGR
jgi:lipoic acid synthetase